MSTKNKNSWIVEVTCTVTKELVCTDCTLDEVTANPFDYVDEERELSMTDWEVESVSKNE